MSVINRARRGAAAIGCLLVLTTAWVAIGEAESAPGADGATRTIDEFHAALLDVMKHADELGYEGRLARLSPVVVKIFDLDFMGEKSAGRHWKGFDDAQKKRWQDTFARHTVATYAGRFDGYSGQQFRTLGSEPAAFDTLLVRTSLTDPKEDNVQINYRLRKNGDGWRVIDIYLSGTVSELALRRAEYGSVIERDGLDKLINDLEGKIKEYQSGASG